MRALSDWLEAYGESHQNPINQKIHKVAVPGIFLSVVGLLWSIPPLTFLGFNLNWVWVAAIPAWVFYLRLSLTVFTLMLAYTLACIGFIWSMETLNWPVLQISILLFGVLWVFQFIGHKIEGKKPSFFEDVQFLLIGPIWVFLKH
ncbi:Mpo1 family 2-hydroxy fatty acid dioxygenase [Vibrio alfacsensis]|uniref:Mpo1 family 2-hydroxy fatty acid dioxygenase n=1 Tax=Vibrio alfacsensis TaxID=1074311 RepID=UPI0040682183